MADNKLDDSSMSEMSDEDFLNAFDPDKLATSTSEEESEENLEEEENTDESNESDVSENEDQEQKAESDSNSDNELTEEEDTSNEEEEDGEDPLEDNDEENTDSSDSEEEEDSKNNEDEENEDFSENNYKKFYDKVMAPFTANGKEVKLNTPEEAIQLMQKGANYTRKMQSIAPYRKTMTMLQNNNINEDQLSFLIDLNNGESSAIQKYFKDKQIDPMDIDTDSESTYKEGSHKVSDNEATLNTKINEIGSTNEGMDTIRAIKDSWDDASKNELFDNPQIMDIIHSHKQSGIYDKIQNELNRRATLGQLPEGIPFIRAYQQIGSELDQQGLLSDGSQQQSRQKATRKPQKIESKASKKKSKVDNSDKAKAASPTRSTPQKSKSTFNPLEGSDDDFLKYMEGRV